MSEAKVTECYFCKQPVRLRKLYGKYLQFNEDGSKHKETCFALPSAAKRESQHARQVYKFLRQKTGKIHERKGAYQFESRALRGV